MRALMIAVGIVLAMTFLLAALLILTTGKAFIFTMGVGYSNRTGGIAAVALGAFWVGLASGAVLLVVAHLIPRRYYQLMWWRDASFVVSAVSVLLATALVVWKQFAYGAL